MNHAAAERAEDGAVTLLLCGDVMLGRGVDQILPHPGDPTLRERSVRDARTYVSLAAEVNGSIPQPVDWSWPWGDALELLARDRLRRPDHQSGNQHHHQLGLRSWQGRPLPDAPGQRSRSPSIVQPDVCVLANNHVLDFGRRGLLETLDVLAAAGLRTAGAGRSLAEAAAPAVVPTRRSEGRVVVFAFGTPSSGVPQDWAAAVNRAGINLIAPLTDAAADELCRRADGGTAAR